MSITEILIVVTLLSIIAVVLISAFKPGTQIAKARDARRKSDLQKLKNPLEDYYNDNKCYPDPSLLDCKLPVDNPGSKFQPYKDKVPCDPETGKSYYYESPDCNTYYFYVKLENENDPAIAEAGCTSGCGPVPFNWGISSPNTSLTTRSVESGECTGPYDSWWACQGTPAKCNNFGKIKPVGIPSWCNMSNCGGSC